MKISINLTFCPDKVERKIEEMIKEKYEGKLLTPELKEEMKKDIKIFTKEALRAGYKLKITE